MNYGYNPAIKQINFKNKTDNLHEIDIGTNNCKLPHSVITVTSGKLNQNGSDSCSPMLTDISANSIAYNRADAIADNVNIMNIKNVKLHSSRMIWPVM